MPELPEVETVVRALEHALVGREVARVRFLGAMRRPFNPGAFTRALRGKTVLAVRRRAKYIVVDFDAPFAILAHLGMTGFFHLEPAGSDCLKHDRAAFAFADGEELRYADARRFGFVDLFEKPSPDSWPREFAELGPEPLARAFSGAVLAGRARGRRCPAKPFVMDQRIVVGVGNIYASEAFHLAGIDPRRLAMTLSAGEWDRLAKSIKAILRKAVRKGGSTINNYRTVDGGEGMFQRHLRVYGRAGGICPSCGGVVETARLGGRSTFFCGGCQK